MMPFVNTSDCFNKKMMFTSRAKIELFDTDTFDTKI